VIYASIGIVNLRNSIIQFTIGSPELPESRSRRRGKKQNWLP